LSFFDKIGKLDAGSSFLEQVAGGFFSSENLRDYTHASKLFRSDSYALAPQQKFLFHVYFTLTDPAASPSSDRGLVGALVKSVTLPSYEIDTQEYIQYNRKRLVHNRIQYQPVEIKLHDDSSDNVRSLWYNYYNYYFADPSYEYVAGQSQGYHGRDLYNPEKVQKDWGLTTSSPNGIVKPAFFRDIKIYGFSRGNYVLYTLINPMITSWRHDTYDYSQTTGTMEHSVTLRYEAVKYAKGRVADGVDGFADPSRYDTQPGPLGKPGSTASILGEGGALDAITGAASDLASGNFLGAIQKAGRSITTFKKSPLSFSQIAKQELKTEALKQGRILLTGAGKGNSTAHGPGLSFPKIGDFFKGNGNKAATPKQGDD
jgi:hypothetical protein